TTTPRWSTRTRGSGRRLRRWRAGGSRSGTKFSGGRGSEPRHSGGNRHEGCGRIDSRRGRLAAARAARRGGAAPSEVRGARGARAPREVLAARAGGAATGESTMNTQRFQIGDVVRVIEPSPHQQRYLGAICTITSDLFEHDGELVHMLDLEPKPGYRGVCAPPRALELVYDGNRRVSWDQC